MQISLNLILVKSQPVLRLNTNRKSLWIINRKTMSDLFYISY